MSRQILPATQDWKAGLFDPGEGGDCLRSCFIGCDQFGRTNHRLQHLERHEDPTDLSKYDGCNENCWNYALLCIGTLGIGSGVYTGKQTRRIRDIYGIKGDYTNDVAKGIFCQPCSLIRNGLEIRQRNADNVHLGLFQAPIPLGENQYEPIYAMGTNLAYSSEPQMSAAHIHLGGEGQDPRIVPLYPDGPQLPQIPQIASPLQTAENFVRRAQVLTPITERDSSEDPRIQQQRENIPNFPQVHGWLQSVQATEPEKVCLGFCKEAKGKKSKGKKKAGKVGLPVQVKAPGLQCQTCGGKKKVVLAAMPPAEQTDDVLVEVTQVVERVEEAEQTDEPQTRTLRRSLPRDHRISGDILVEIPSAQPLDHRMSRDIRVTFPLESENEHDIQIHAQVHVPEATPAQGHIIKADENVSAPQLVDHEHRISADDRLAVDATPLQAHNLASDELVEEPEEPGLEGDSQEHTILADPQVQANLAATNQHDLESDSRVPTPTPKTQNHRLSKDSRVPTPTARAFEHGIHLDERIPVPELMLLNVGHSLIQDRKVLSPSPQLEDHDIHADGRVKSPALSPPRGHELESDSQIHNDQSFELKEHGIQAEDRAPSPMPARVKDHGLNSDIKVAQRAHQLLEHFLEQDRKASRASSRSGRG
ncbi:hypothetical protein QBC42DRAFT_297115 [Cladorrhinum samala]|uniref:C2H2-type domain-containing protein n=1 Tax=Cladorrhinum samala TaxID=585594 RepID=A0AAV9HN03_9PEZI|nr:hypothetical protein QBC42DRAFT_297115 [Cladorrhinum samala]